MQGPRLDSMTQTCSICPSTNMPKWGRSLCIECRRAHDRARNAAARLGLPLPVLTRPCQRCDDRPAVRAGKWCLDCKVVVRKEIRQREYRRRYKPRQRVKKASKPKPVVVVVAKAAYKPAPLKATAKQSARAAQPPKEPEYFPPPPPDMLAAARERLEKQRESAPSRWGKANIFERSL